MARIRSGFIKWWRSILDDWIGRDANTYLVFSYLCLRANWRESGELLRGTTVRIQRGQLVTSPAEIAAHWKLDRKTVERRLDVLERSGAIVQQVSNRGRIITVCKYEHYQDFYGDDDQQSGQQEGLQNGLQKGHLGRREEGEECKNPLGARARVDGVEGDEELKALLRQQVAAEELHRRVTRIVTRAFAALQAPNSEDSVRAQIKDDEGADVLFGPGGWIDWADRYAIDRERKKMPVGVIFNMHRDRVIAELAALDDRKADSPFKNGEGMHA